jgi:LPXTG-motif cell wall-anchored protein
MYYTPDDDGIGGTVTYSIKFEASSNNTYTMDNVKVYDYINSSTLPDVSLVSDSMYLYNGDATTADKQAALDKKTGSKTKVTCSEIKYDSGTKYENCTECDSTKGVYSGFICYVGDFAPGVTKTLVYSIKVHDSMYFSSNNHFTLTNRINLFEDDTKNTASKNPTKNDPSRIGGYGISTAIKYSSWEEKYNGIRQETGSTVDMNDNVYYYDDTASNDKSFDVKMGYYKYRVIINQNGKLDVTAVDLKDTLGNYMQYAGYLRIDEYATLEDETLFDSDYNASDPGELSETIQETAWLKIDGLTSFNFKLKDIGLTGKHAYVLTYYTKITYDGDDLYVSTNNKFDMSGTVTGSGGTYILGGIGVGVTLQAMKSTSFSAEKNAMYYERASASDTSEWSKGALYWNIRIVGTDIPENTILKDQVEKSSASNGITDHKLVESDSLVGIYITDNNYTISTVEDLQTNGVLLDSSYYTVSWDVDNNNVSISFPNGYEIPNGKILYILLKTAVTDYPATNNTYIYRNSLWQQIGDKSMQQVGSTIEKSVKAVNTANKAAEQIFTYDGETYTRLGGTSTVNNGEWGNYSIPGDEKSTDKDKQMIKEPGTYIEYELNTCLNGSITGEVEFSDVLPEGLELVYIRNGYFEGMSCDDVEIEELENDPNWTRYKNGDKPFAGSTTGYCISYYNKATREIRWKLANVKGTSGRLNFQLIVKVVDEEVLIGAKTGKYTNSLTVIQNGIVVEKVSSNEVTLKRKALTKEINGSASGYVIPFKIVVNDDGEDLLSNKKEITLVDEMSSSLTIDIPTIKVTDKYGTEVADCKIAMEKEEDKTYLKITIPDDEKIIITYNAKVNVPENTSVAISNVAYWEGYDPDPDTEVVNSSFSYSLKAQADISGHASLKLTKRDEEDIMTTLAGAEYSMQKAELQSDGTYKLVGEAHTVTTDKDGVAYFSTDEDNYWMEYNTIYCLTEITAPEGYILDTEPQYILLATKDNKSEYPASVQVQRNSSQYVFEAVDMPKPTYALPSAGGTGTYPIYATGGILLVVSAAGYVYQKKRKK